MVSLYIAQRAVAMAVSNEMDMERAVATPLQCALFDTLLYQYATA